MSITTNTTARDFYRGKRVLVVGAGGFLGWNAANRLAALSADVTALFRKGPAPALPSVGTRLVGDLKDPEVSFAAVRGREIVLNFVGVTSAVSSNRNPCLSLMEECFPHLNLLAACAEEASPPLIVFPSSRLVYGKPVYLPVDELHPTAPTNIYGVHKLTVESYLSVYQQTRGVPYLILRISNAYGPHPRYRNKGYGIINYFLQLAAQGETIRVFGDGSQLRDFIYIDDLIDTILRTVMVQGCHNQIFNLGAREPISLREAAESISRIAGGTPVEFVPWPDNYRMVETGDYLSCLDKICQFIDPSNLLPFNKGLARSLASYRDPAVYPNWIDSPPKFLDTSLAVNDIARN